MIQSLKKSSIYDVEQLILNIGEVWPENILSSIN